LLQNELVLLLQHDAAKYPIKVGHAVESLINIAFCSPNLCIHNVFFLAKTLYSKWLCIYNRICSVIADKCDSCDITQYQFCVDKWLAMHCCHFCIA